MLHMPSEQSCLLESILYFLQVISLQVRKTMSMCILLSDLPLCFTPGFRFQWAILQELCQNEDSEPQISCSMETKTEVYNPDVDAS